MTERLAITGGPRAIARPTAGWPQYDEADEAMLLAALRDSTGCASDARAVGYTLRFEREFAERHGRRYGVACANCTVGLEGALAVAGIGPGDEVIVPPYTFMATAACVVRAGAVPVFCDVDPRTACLDPGRLDDAVTERTKAVIPVHFAGYIDDMSRLRDRADERDLLVLEDAAQAHGASRDGQYAGAFGYAAVFSFQRNKNMSAGEGGILLTDDEATMEAFREHLWHGTRQGGLPGHHSIGSNLRITEFQSALLLAQSEKLDEQNERRMRACDELDEIVDHMQGFERCRYERRGVHARHLYLLRIDPEYWDGVPKAAIVECLQAEGLCCSVGYDLPLYRQPAFRDGAYPSWYEAANRQAFEEGRLDFSRTYLENVEALCRETIMIPHFVFLSVPPVADRIGHALAKLTARRDEVIRVARERSGR